MYSLTKEPDCYINIQYRPAKTSLIVKLQEKVALSLNRVSRDHSSLLSKTDKTIIKGVVSSSLGRFSRA